MSYTKPIAFLKKSLIHETSYKMSFSLRMFEGFFSVTVFYFLAQLIGTSAAPHLQSYGGDYFSFVLVGIAFSSFLKVGLESFAENIRVEQLIGTLEAMLITPTRPSVIILSSSLWNCLLSSFTVLLCFVSGVVFFGLDISQANIGATLLLLVLTIIIFSGIGIVSASFMMVFKKGAPLNWLVNQTARFLGGVFYPIDILPVWLRKLSYLHPITYTLEAMRRALLQGDSFMQLIPELVVLVIFSAISLPLGMLVFKFAVQRAKQQGSLSFY